MERAQREADGPRRRIIEAARAKEKATAAAAAAAKAEAPAPRAKAVAESAPAASAPKPAPSAAPTGAVAAPVALPAAAPLAAPAAVATATSAAVATAAPALADQPLVALALPQAPSGPQLMPAPRSAAEDAYAQDLNRLVDGLKRYPTSREARTLRPQGTVQLWLEVDRSGQLLQVGVASSSGAPLLDGEALRSVRAGRYAAFPAGAFDGQASRRFLVAIEYRPDGG